MPRSDDSAPNFDFLDDEPAESGASESALNLLDPPAESEAAAEGDPFDFSANEADEEDERPVADEPSADSPVERSAKRRKTSRSRPKPAAEPDDTQPLPTQGKRRRRDHEPSETLDLGELAAEAKQSEGTPAEDEAVDDDPVEEASRLDEAAEPRRSRSKRSRSPSGSDRSRSDERSRSKRRSGRSPGDTEADDGASRSRRRSSRASGRKPEPGGRRRSRSPREDDTEREPDASEGDQPPQKRSGRAAKSDRSSRSRSTANRSGGSGLDWDAIRAAGGHNLIVGLATYAGLATLLLAWLLMSNPERSALESLPDVPPSDPESIPYVAPTAEVPAGHTVALGESQRFGHIAVQPLRVVRGPVDFAHESDPARERMFGNESDALQLHLRLTNTSPEDGGQNIVPLDRQLVYHRLSTAANGLEIKANQYVYDPDARERPVAMMVELAPDGEWTIAGQSLPTLAPGESVETLLAATALGDEPIPSGSLVWRIQLRKGHHLPSGHGVTTLVDVPFDAADVSDG